MTTNNLLEMLSYSRPHGTPIDQQFVDTFIAPLGARPDAFGNMILRIGNLPVLWSCHTDTVDARPVRKRIVLHDDLVKLGNGKAGMCLGADDTVGVWIMSEMVRAQVPGVYVFHRGEEKGGLGSQYLVTRTPHMLDGIMAAIAFDRKGTQSVITHQLGERCCSETFSRELAERIGLGYHSDSTGVFTDTANYMHLIPECTNLSVGYEREHGPTEALDLGHAVMLRDAMCSGYWDGLPVERDPAADPFADEWDTLPYRRGNSIYDEELISLVMEYPDTAAQILTECGVSAREFLSYVRKNH